jgi:hypothetical protein
MFKEALCWKVLYSPTPHCTENLLFVFPEKELPVLSPNSYINMSVSELYIERIGLHIWLQQNG